MGAAISAARDAGKKDGILVSIPLVSAATVYKGQGVVTSSAGLAKNDNTPAAGDSFVGVAYETVTNASGGSSEVRVENKGSFIFLCSGADQTWVGKIAYLDIIAGYNTVNVTAAGSHGVTAGKVVEYIDSTHVRVKIDPAGSAAAS